MANSVQGEKLSRRWLPSWCSKSFLSFALEDRTINQAEACLHLAGEFGGDQSDRDKEINQEMADLRCDDVVDSLKLLQVTLPNSSKQRDDVRALLKAYE